MREWCQHCGQEGNYHAPSGLCLVGPTSYTTYYLPVGQRTLAVEEAVKFMRGKAYRKPLALAAAPIEVPETLNEADTLRLRALGVTW